MEPGCIPNAKSPEGRRLAPTGDLTRSASMQSSTGLISAFRLVETSQSAFCHRALT